MHLHLLGKGEFLDHLKLVILSEFFDIHVWKKRYLVLIRFQQILYHLFLLLAYTAFYLPVIANFAHL
jgi:hypothetical protein